jgi:hypothetical protein
MKHIAILVRAWLCLFLIIGLSGSMLAQNWQSLDTTGFSNGIATYTYLAFGNGVPHLAFSDASRRGRATMMSYTACGAWQNVGNAGFSAGEASHVHLAFDGSTPFVSYTDWANGFKATVMRYNGSNWQPVGSAGFTPGKAWFSSMAVNGGQPFVAFQDASRSSKLTVMRYNGSSWQLVGEGGFSDGIASFIQIVFQGNTPYVVFLDAGNRTRISVMRFDGSAWVKVGVGGFSPGTASYPSLAFDGTTPYVAFQDGTRNNRATLMKFENGAWTTVSAGFSAGTAEYLTLAFSNSAEPHVGYRDGANGNRATVLKYNGISWEAVDKAGFSGSRVEYTHLIFDAGKPYIAFQDGSKRRKATVMGLGGPKIELFGNSRFIENGDQQPDSLDHTDYGRTFDLTRSFTIENPGSATLAICSIGLSGNNSSDFSIINAPASVPPSGKATFSVRFRPSASGKRTATLTIRSNAPDDISYSFGLTGRRPTDPKISIKGNSLLIPNAKSAPNLTDHTDFGAVPTQLTRVFQVENTGNDTLFLSLVYLVGSPDFVIESFPNRVNESRSASIRIRFSPTIKGEQSAELFITSNDESNPIYYFSIKANSAPAITVSGNNQIINSGDRSPSLNDHTAFGAHVVSQTFSRTFTISNPSLVEDLTISEITIDNPVFGLERSPGIIRSSSSADFVVNFKPTSAGRSNGEVRIKNNAGNDYVFAINAISCLPPPEPATGIVFRPIPNNSINISWTNGTGQRRLVLLKADLPIAQGPVSTQTYTANSDFSQDTLVSVIDGAKVVFQGTQNRVTVTGLSRNVEYYAAVYEFNLPTADCPVIYSTGAFSTPTTEIESDLVASVYPNPAQNILTVVLSDKANVSLWSVDGIECLRTEIDQKGQIDVSKLIRGVYLLKLETQTKAYVLKVVLE